METLEHLRKEIDQIDDEMQALFLRRMEVVRLIAEIKAAEGLEIYCPEREAALVHAKLEELPEVVSEEYESFLKHVMELSKQYQKKLIDGWDVNPCAKA